MSQPAQEPLEMMYITDVSQLEPSVYYALPHEVAELEREVASIRIHRAELSGHISDAMEQSSETWHDNAPADALFGAMRQLDTREVKLAAASRKIVLLAYPTADLEVVTIGSRVLCLQGSEEFFVDIAGNLPLTRAVHDTDIEVATVNAPMTRALLGRAEGETVDYEVGSRRFNIAVLAINQTVQQQSYQPIEPLSAEPC
jgi:transcription elongation GreA/GreB family factor